MNVAGLRRDAQEQCVGEVRHLRPAHPAWDPENAGRRELRYGRYASSAGPHRPQGCRIRRAIEDGPAMFIGRVRGAVGHDVYGDEPVQLRPLPLAAKRAHTSFDLAAYHKKRKRENEQGQPTR